MEYFLMKMDERLTNPIKLKFTENQLKSKEPFVIYGDYNERTNFGDYFYMKQLFDYYFCASDVLKELLDIYADKLEAVPFFITNQEKTQQRVYWKIDIAEEKDVICDASKGYQSLTLWQERIKQRYIFRVTFEKQQYLIVSLHLAENILRKNLYGIQFIPVKLK